MSVDAKTGLLLYGMAAVVDTAVLLVLLESRNRARVMRSVITLIAGVWLYHAASTAHILLYESRVSWVLQADRVAMVLMAAGLLLQPSAALHTSWRLHRHGFAPRIPLSPLVIVFYLPLLLLVDVCHRVANAAANSSTLFFTVMQPYLTPYLIWLAFAHSVAAGWCLWLRSHHTARAQQHFLGVLAATLLALVAIPAFVALVAMPAIPHWRPWLLALTTVAPVGLALLLADAIMRHGLLQLVLRRTVVYGTAVAAFMLFHSVVVQEIIDNLNSRYHLDFALLEGALAVALVLGYAPLRERVSEALRYLVGERYAVMRQQTTQLARDMASMFAEPPAAIVQWFAEASQTMLAVKYVGVWLFDAQGEVTMHGGSAQDRLTDSEAQRLFADLCREGKVVFPSTEAPTVASADCMQRVSASLAAVICHPQIHGLLLVGGRKRRRDFSGEQMGNIHLLVEQLGITLSNAMLHADRCRAERQAMHNDKLATLGLVASSIAHEVKNPLSSIKTITTLLAEDLADDPEKSMELAMVTGEVDRLSRTVQDILAFARPAKGETVRASMNAAVAGTLHIMRHVAKQRGVTVDVDVAEDLPDVRSDENALREVVFNLVANAIEAAGVGGHVCVAAQVRSETVELEVRDDGPGVSADVQNSLFDPFVTTRDSGTGLGLFVVNRRVRDSGGRISCHSTPEQGTRFVVALPPAEQSRL